MAIENNNTTTRNRIIHTLLNPDLLYIELNCLNLQTAQRFCGTENIVDEVSVFPFKDALLSLRV